MTNKRSWRLRVKKGVVYAAVATGLSLFWLKVFDLGLLLALRAPELAPEHERMLFPPGSRATYKTREFDIRVAINRFGFRGSESELRRGQILAIGDSTTYGWGVGDKETWPFLLQENLRRSSPDVDVYNLGAPGTDTEEHLETARYYVQLLQPRLVILSILMGDDLQQVVENHCLSDSSQTQRAMLSSRDIARKTLPGIRRLCALVRHSRAPGDEATLSANWGNGFQWMVQRFGLKLDERVRSDGIRGNINPAMFYLAAKYPDRHAWLYEHRDDSRVQSVMIGLRASLGDLDEEVRTQGGTLVVFLMPSPAYVSSRANDNCRAYGFRLPADYAATSAPEDFTEQCLCAPLRLKCVSALQAFRSKHSEQEDLFFPLDGHPTPGGNRLAADVLTPVALRP